MGANYGRRKEDNNGISMLPIWMDRLMNETFESV